MAVQRLSPTRRFKRLEVLPGCDPAESPGADPDDLLVSMQMITSASITSHHRAIRCLLVALLILLPTFGCGQPAGPPRVAVSGKVTFDGEPLPFGIIRFIPQKENEGPGVLTQIVDGEFRFSEADGPVIADHRVEIEATDFHGFSIDDEAAFAAEVQKTGKSPMAENPIPAVYNRASTLTATVTSAADQVLAFDLKSTL